MNKIEITYKKILETISTPVMVIEPLFSKSHKIVDYSVYYASEGAYQGIFSTIKKGSRYVDYKNVLPHDVDWFESFSTALENQKTIEKDFLSQMNCLWFHVVIITLEQKYILCTFQEITTLKNNQHYLDTLKGIDPLTGLANRSFFTSDLNTLITNRPTTLPFYIVIFDIDDMKGINMLQGHASGDSLLKQISIIFSDFASENQKFYRLGDDEFSLLYTEPEYVKFASYIKDLFCVFSCYHISISAGISSFPEDSINISNLVKFAELALRHVKENGKNAFLSFNKSMYHTYINHCTIKQNMLKALNANLFELYYQPQFDIQNNTLRGFEALIRLHDKEQIISPEEFIPIAEESKLIIYIGRWIIENAFSSLKELQKTTHFNGIFSINISPVQLEDPSFIKDFSMLLDKYSIMPSSIELEITERIFVKNIEQMNDTLHLIHDMGVQISLDDFGTGYASLRYLQKLPISTLKMDKSFIDHIEDNSFHDSGNEIMRNIISVVSKNGIATVAEGVENDVQLSILRDLHCRYIQGFLWGKPMPLKQCESFLQGDLNALDHITCEPHTIHF